MITSNFELEKKLSKEGYEAIIGIDEAGRGPLAGPVVACAVCPLPALRATLSLAGERELKSEVWNLIRDSKTLSEKQREKLYDFICENFHIGVGVCDHKTIDRINILEASFLAMKKAISVLAHNVERVSAKNDTRYAMRDMRKIILLDGNKAIPNISITQRTIVNGDKIVKSISAASIIAKVTRDRIMREMHKKYPAYDFCRHKGYGTKKHLDALQNHGPCPIHRQSFAPIKKLSTAPFGKNSRWV